MNYKWTILFLVHASDGHTRKHAEQLFRILQATDCNETVKVLVLYGSLQSSQTEGYKIQVKLSEIVKENAGNKLVLTEVTSYGVIDMGDDKKLGPVFSEIKRNYPSERFLLFTWDHGSGFGIFKTNPSESHRSLQSGLFAKERQFNLPEDVDAATIMINLHSHANNAGSRRLSTFTEDKFTLSVISSEPFEEIRNRGIRSIERKIREEAKTSMLTNDELRNILKHDSQDGQIDLLIMMNCMMQMIETGYALHDAVEYLVAPETCIFWAGYDYIEIINKLCASPEIETEAIARYAIDTIERYYKSTPFRDDLNDLVVSLVKPLASKAVKKAIDEIADELCDDLKAAEDDIKAIRRRCEDLSKKFVLGLPYHYVDFVNYIYCLSTKSKKLELDRSTLQMATKGYVIHMYKGDNYNKLNEDGVGIVNGYTIYFPPTGDEAYNDFYYDWFYKEGRHQTRFADRSSWKKFLIKYFKVERE